jgi:hypothetical protein
MEEETNIEKKLELISKPITSNDSKNLIDTS